MRSLSNQWLRVHVLLIRSKSLLFSTLETIKTKTRGLGVCMISTRAKLTKTQQYPKDLKYTEGHVDDSDHGGNRPVPLPKIRHIKHNAWTNVVILKLTNINLHILGWYEFAMASHFLAATTVSVISSSRTTPT